MISQKNHPYRVTQMPCMSFPEWTRTQFIGINAKVHRIWPWPLIIKLQYETSSLPRVSSQLNDQNTTISMNCNIFIKMPTFFYDKIDHLSWGVLTSFSICLKIGKRQNSRTAHLYRIEWRKRHQHRRDREKSVVVNLKCLSFWGRINDDAIICIVVAETNA